VKVADETVTTFSAGASMRGYLFQVRVALLWASFCAGHRVEKERHFPPDATNDDF
jgi:hypothetical protein